ncbi:SKP1-like protein 14 [Populus alba x Populus x berolinensis]|uniref:SKP1-like protein 14 n=1 Tax=Populus alba x Populus x berolinensis TaxID=444605 RepID=A0AAD6W2G1_9ROSI|nr:SKP1-like protein 14 [Populus alba x Populus x berolinensis]KAJ6996813.1 SKP1-like protein 14 [Populus alba x Populus x berolinensis]
MEFATVKSFFEDSPSSTDTVPLPNVTAKPLSQVIEFCKEEKSDKDLVDMIPVANYLEIKDLLDVLNQAVADRIENKSVEYVRGFFGIDNDFTAEEEAALRQEHAWAYEGVDED